MRDLVELGAHGVVDLRDAVAVDVAPETRDAVEVAAAPGVVEVGSFTALDDEGIVLAPLAHGGEGMPHVRVILARKTRGARAFVGWWRDVLRSAVVGNHGRWGELAREWKKKTGVR